MSADLPRTRIVYKLAENELACACGCQLEVIGEDVSEQLEIIPAQMVVIEHAKLKYACKRCQGNVKLQQIVGPLYGKMKMGVETIYHRTVYDFESLSQILMSTGFINVHKYDRAF